jgi:hypothetical protein
VRCEGSGRYHSSHRGDGVWSCSLPSWALRIREKKAYIFGRWKGIKEAPATVINQASEDGA